MNSTLFSLNKRILPKENRKQGPKLALVEILGTSKPNQRKSH